MTKTTPYVKMPCGLAAGFFISLQSIVRNFLSQCPQEKDPEKANSLIFVSNFDIL